MEIHRARMLLEPAIAEQAALNATCADLGALRSALDVMIRAESDWVGFLQAEKAFHLGVARAINNRALTLVLHELLGVEGSMEPKASDNQPSSVVIEHLITHHELILAAMESHVGPSARKQMTNYLRCLDAAIREGLWPISRRYSYKSDRSITMTEMGIRSLDLSPMTP